MSVLARVLCMTAFGVLTGALAVAMGAPDWAAYFGGVVCGLLWYIAAAVTE